MTANFTYPPAGTFASVYGAQFLNVFDTLMVEFEAPWPEVRIIMSCQFDYCGESEEIECQAHQYVNEGPLAAKDLYNIRSLDWLGMKNTESNLTQLPQGCAMALKPWDAPDNPPDGGTPIITALPFTVSLSDMARATTYAPSLSSAATTASTEATGTSLVSSSALVPSPVPSTTTSTTSTTSGLTDSSSSTSTVTSNSVPSTTSSPSNPAFTDYSTPISADAVPPSEPLDLTKGARIGIGIGSGLGGLILIALVLIGILQWRKIRQARSKAPVVEGPEQAKPELPAYAEKDEATVAKDAFVESEELEGSSKVELESPRDGVSRHYQIDLGHVHELH